MKKQIDTIIFNTLRKGRDLYLPNVGTLVVRRASAERSSKHRVEAPYREVVFTGENRGVSLIDIIVLIASVTQERATDIYSQWLQQSQTDGVVTIGGVGVVRDRQFIAEKSFAEKMNPSRKFIALPSRSHKTLYAFVALCVLVAVGVGGYMLYSNGALQSVRSVVNQEQVAEESQSTLIEPTASSEQEPTTVQEAVAAPSVASEQSADAVQEPVVEQAVVSPHTTDAYAPLPMSAGYSYAVWGVYSERANAERYMRAVKNRFSDLESHIYIYGERYMVAVYERPSRSECVRLVARLKSRDAAFKDMWVYTNSR